MRYFPPLSVIAAGALLVATGCSAGGASAIAPAAAQPVAFSRLHGRPLATPGHDFIYVADAGLNTVWIFPGRGADPSPVGSITNGVNGPQGMYIDSRGNLYVTNPGNATVTIYSPGSSTPSLTLTKDLTVPAAVAVDSKGNIWVDNAEGSYHGSVVEFPAGSSTPSTVISGISPFGLALDSKGSLYVATHTYTKGNFIAVYPPGATQPTKEFGQADLKVPAAVNVGPKGDIAVVDGYLNKMFIYAPKTYKLRHTTYVAGARAQLTLAQNKRLYVATGMVVSEVSRDGFGHVLKDELQKGMSVPDGVVADPPVPPGP